MKQITFYFNQDKGMIYGYVGQYHCYLHVL